MSETITEPLGETARETVRIPANIMGLLRRSYDSREKVLDWTLAIIVAVAVTWAFKAQIQAMFVASLQDPNAGKADEPQPNQDVGTAFPYAGRDGGRWPALYAYNMPGSRNIRSSVGPNGTAPPVNPSFTPMYPVPTGDC